MKPGKVHFWQITGIFVLFVVLAVGLQWHTYQVQEQDMMAQMMGQSMGNMMRTIHASNVTLAQLLLWPSGEGVVINSYQGEAHGFLQWMNRFSTDVVFLLSPLILAGAITLLIVWRI